MRTRKASMNTGDSPSRLYAGTGIEDAPSCSLRAPSDGACVIIILKPRGGIQWDMPSGAYLQLEGDDEILLCETTKVGFKMGSMPSTQEGEISCTGGMSWVASSPALHPACPSAVPTIILDLSCRELSVSDGGRAAEPRRPRGSLEENARIRLDGATPSGPDGP